MTPATPFSLFDPSTFVEGGLIDDINGKITDAKFTMYDYNGKSDGGAVPALGIEIELEDGVKHESYYSAGDAKFWAPSADGKTLTPTSDKTSLSKSSKLGIFLTELINAGFPVTKLQAGDITCLIGLQAHFVRKADKERKGLTRKDEKAQSTLCVVKVISMPGEQPKAAAKQTAVGAPSGSTGSPAATTAGSTGGSSSDVDDDTTNVLLEIVPAQPGGVIAKNRISQAVFKHIGKDSPLLPQRAAITQRAMQDEFLKAGAANGLWEFDGTNVKIG